MNLALALRMSVVRAVGASSSGLLIGICALVCAPVLAQARPIMHPYFQRIHLVSNRPADRVPGQCLHPVWATSLPAGHLKPGIWCASLTIHYQAVYGFCSLRSALYDLHVTFTMGMHGRHEYVGYSVVYL